MIGVASVKGRPTWRRLGTRPRGPRPRRAGPGGRDGRGAHARLRRRPIAGRPGRRRGRPLPPVRVAARRLPGRSARARRPAHRLHRRPVTGRVPGPRRARALRSPRARVRPRLRRRPEPGRRLLPALGPQPGRSPLRPAVPPLAPTGPAGTRPAGGVRGGPSDRPARGILTPFRGQEARGRRHDLERDLISAPRSVRSVRARWRRVPCDRTRRR
jgi:hypothetical protein